MPAISIAQTRSSASTPRGRLTARIGLDLAAARHGFRSRQSGEFVLRASVI
jgi:hypothetical protein